ncbi:MAG: hypothetical protein ACE5H4_11435 [Candidatus Thorarchaeota archaeon]
MGQRTWPGARETISSSTARVKDIIVSVIQSGLSIFHESFSTDSIDPDLFSALLTAIFFAKKVKGSHDSELVYESHEIDSHLVHICYGDYLAGIAVAEGAVDDRFMRRLKGFVTTYENEYGLLLTNWDGDRSFFDHEWASRQLKEHISPPRPMYRLYERAMERATSARQIRLVLLIRRSASLDTFSFDSMSKQLSESLVIPEETASEYLLELEQLGMVVRDT